jgi:hypothetical protein
MATANRLESISLSAAEFLTSYLENPVGSNCSRSDRPIEASWIVANRAARKCAAISGSSAISLLPTGYTAILSEAVTIWKIQSQMVVDIAALFGKTPALTPRHMIYCLLRHGGNKAVASALLQPTIQLMIKRLCTRFVRDFSTRLGLRISGRALGPGAALVLQALSSIGFATLAYLDTRRVASRAVELFSQTKAMPL